MIRRTRRTTNVDVAFCAFQFLLSSLVAWQPASRNPRDARLGKSKRPSNTLNTYQQRLELRLWPIRPPTTGDRSALPIRPRQRPTTTRPENASARTSSSGASTIPFLIRSKTGTRLGQGEMYCFDLLSVRLENVVGPDHNTAGCGN